MITTLTLNTAIDMNIHCPPLKAATVNRTQSARYFPNGKGVNVSIILEHYGISSPIMGLFGGFTGHYIVDTLKAANYQVTPVWVTEPTRINIFINDTIDEYKLVSPGSMIPLPEQHALLNEIREKTDLSHLVISGSLPPGINENYYHQIIDLCLNKKTEIILDISHPILKTLLNYRPLLIKPNNDEVREIFGLEVNNHPQAIIAMKEMHRAGARNILLTMGAGGLYFSDAKTLWYCNAPVIPLISSACAGDAALAAFLSIWLLSGDVPAAMKLASATGADVAGSEGLGDLQRVETWLSQLSVQQITQD